MKPIPLIKTAILAAALAVSGGMTLAGTYNVSVDKIRIDTGEFKKTGIGYNGSQSTDRPAL